MTYVNPSTQIGGSKTILVPGSRASESLGAVKEALAAADSTWQDPVFENGFTDHNPDTPVGFRKLTSGQVMLRGYAKVGTYTGSDDVIFTLPAGWRSAQDMFFACIVYVTTTGKQSHSIPARLRINATGEVMLSRVSSTDFVQTGTAQIKFSSNQSASGSAVFPIPYLTTPNAVGNLQNANSYINAVGGGVSTTQFNIYLRDIRLSNRSDTVQVSWMAQGTPDLNGVNSHVMLDGVTFLAEQ